MARYSVITSSIFFAQRASEKKFKNRSIFGEDMNKSCSLLFGPFRSLL